MQRASIQDEISQINRANDELLRVLMSKEAENLLTTVDDSEKAKQMKAAVRLHNKVRQQVHAQLKATTKACSALMLMLFNNQPVPRAICSIIKLLSRSGYEMQPYAPEVALRCSASSIAMWRKLSVQALARTLSHLELDEVKVAVFQAFLDQADLLVQGTSNQKSGSGNELTSVRSAVCGAMEIVQSLPDRLKMSFIDRVVQLSAAVVNLNFMNDAIYLLQITLNNIDVLLSTIVPRRSADNEGNEDGSLGPKDIDDLYSLKIRALLSITFAYKEMK